MNKLDRIGRHAQIARDTIALDAGKKMVVRTKYDGNGHSAVVFIVLFDNLRKEEAFKKYDDAADFYNQA
jgi:hypothetical protein